MTTEQQMLFDMARSHSRLALDRLNESNIPFALSHLKEAQRALELYRAAEPKLAAHTSPVIEITATTKQP